MSEAILVSGEANWSYGKASLAYGKASLPGYQQLKELETLIISFNLEIWILRLSLLTEIFELLRNLNPFVISTKSVRWLIRENIPFKSVKDLEMSKRPEALPIWRS